MHNRARIVVVTICACPFLLGMGCSSGNATRGSISTGGSTARGNTVGGAGGGVGVAGSGGGNGTGGSATIGSTSGAMVTGGALGKAGGNALGGNPGGGRNGGGGNGTGGSATIGSTSGAMVTGGAAARGGNNAVGGNTGGGRDGGGVQTGGGGGQGAATSREGFYKEIFMDVGVGLTHLSGLPSADKLGWAWEFVSTEDAEVQHSYMWSNANDDNGVLLYPDREPRFMIIYTGGGYGDHASAVGATGKKNVQDFFYNGGSYVGTCNGNYMAWNWAYKLWPGQITVDSYEGLVDGTIPDDSPILRYYDFGGDHLISGLSHYSGGYETGSLPAGTEVLLIGKSHSASTPINGEGHPTGYAYKPKTTSGRVCGLNDHPEYANQPGEIMSYLQAAFRYARDGLAPPDVKASLVNGEERVMDKSSSDNDPAHARLGDKQYHHFTVALADGAKSLTVALTAEDGYDVNLYLAKDTFALASRASHSDTSQGPNKTLTVSSLEPGTWYIGVECATTVTATKTSHGYDYSGNLAVLNGVKYSIKASWTP